MLAELDSLEDVSSEGDHVDDSSNSKEIAHDATLPLAKPTSQGFDILKWWRDNRDSFPTLSKLARKYLCVRATSCPSERDFSIAGNIVSAKRNCLKPARSTSFVFSLLTFAA